MYRKYTDKLIIVIEEGMVDTKALAEQLAYWVGEDIIKEFWYANGYSELDDSEDDHDRCECDEQGAWYDTSKELH